MQMNESRVREGRSKTRKEMYGILNDAMADHCSTASRQTVGNPVNCVY